MTGYDLAHEKATGIYGLEELKRLWIPGKGYTFTSKKYPEGVPRTMGRLTVGRPPSAASTARALTGEFGRHAQAAALMISSGIPAITAGSAIRDPSKVDEILRLIPSVSSSYGGASSGLAAGGTALARGGPAVGSVPAGGLSLGDGGLPLGGVTTSLGGIGKSITDTGMQLLPLAIKVVIAVIVIKIVLWLIRGRK
jgi:hypothetical protein